MGNEPMEPDTPDATTTEASPHIAGVEVLVGVAVRLTSVGDAVSETGVGAPDGVFVDVGVTQTAFDATQPVLTYVVR